MRNTFWALLICSVFVLAPGAAAQPVGAGLKFGTTFTDALSISDIPFLGIYNQAPFIVGPYLEVRLPFQLAIEGDALYNSDPCVCRPGGQASGSTWQFPLLAKYKLLKGPVRPYIEGGVSFSRVSSFPNYNFPPALLHAFNYGSVLGVGAEIKLRALRITPEIRYNYWALTAIRITTQPGDILLAQSLLAQSERNQVSLLVGFGF